MKRRTLLRTGATVGAVALGGCISNGGGPAGPGAGNETSDEPTDGTTAGDEPTGDGVTLVETEFEILDAGCGVERNVAAVTTDEGAGAVTVEGTITAPSACYTAALAEATYGPETDSVWVAVVTERRSDAGACAQCLTEIEYRVDLAFEGGLPERVGVTHDGTTVCEPDPPTTTA